MSVEKQQVHSESNRYEPPKMRSDLPIVGAELWLSDDKIKPSCPGEAGALKGHIFSEMAGKGYQKPQHLLHVIRIRFMLLW